MATGGSEIETDAVPFNTLDIEFCTFQAHKHLLGSKLKKDNFEILIISHDGDDEYVKKCKDSIEKNVFYKVGERLVNPKVELHREIVYEDDSPTPELDFSLSKTLVVFVFATRAFSEDAWAVFEARVALGKAFDKGNKYEHFVYVVHTKPKECRDYTLLLTVQSVTDLYFSRNEFENKKFYKSVESILESKVHIQIKKNRDLYNERLHFFSETHPNVLAYYKLTDRRSYQRQTPVNKRLVALGQSTRDKSQCSFGNNLSVPASMVPIDPNDDTQVDAAPGNANPADHENLELTLLNPSDSGSSLGSDPESAVEETCPKVVMQSPSGISHHVIPVEESDDVGADNGAIPESPEEKLRINLKSTVI